MCRELHEYFRLKSSVIVRERGNSFCECDKIRNVCAHAESESSKCECRRKMLKVKHSWTREYVKTSCALFIMNFVWDFQLSIVVNNQELFLKYLFFLSVHTLVLITFAKRREKRVNSNNKKKSCNRLRAK